MGDYGSDREFISEEVQKAIDDVFGFKDEPSQVTVTYSKDKVNMWTSQIIDYTIRGLNKLDKPFKYCVTGVVQQNNGAGMTVCASTFQDITTDGFLNVQTEINDIVIIVSVFAMAVLL